MLTKWHVIYGLLYKLDKICVPKGERLQLIREDHISKVVRTFGVGKTISKFHRYVYWPKMQDEVYRLIRGCMLYYTSKPSNKKQGLYHPLPIPTHPWESISMDFLGGLPTIMKGNNYLFMVFYRFKVMCIHMPCKNAINRRKATNLSFGEACVHFGMPRSIVSNKDTRFHSEFWTKL